MTSNAHELDILTKISLQGGSLTIKRNKKNDSILKVAEKLASEGLVVKKLGYGKSIFTITALGSDMLPKSTSPANTSIATEAQTIRQKIRENGKYSTVNGHCDHCNKPKAVTYYHDETDSEVCEKCLDKLNKKAQEG